VFLHVGLLVEALATELAWVRSRVRVDQQVCGESGRPLERLPALLTLQHGRTSPLRVWSVGGLGGAWRSEVEEECAL